MINSDDITKKTLKGIIQIGHKSLIPGDKISDENLQYNINTEAAKISSLPSGKIDKYEFLTGEEILPPDQRRVAEQAKFIYFPQGKSFEKQTKTIEEQGKNKQMLLRINAKDQRL